MAVLWIIGLGILSVCIVVLLGIITGYSQAWEQMRDVVLKILTIISMILPFCGILPGTKKK